MHDWKRWARWGVLASAVVALTGCCVFPPFYVGLCGPGGPGRGGEDRGGPGRGGPGGERHHWRGAAQSPEGTGLATWVPEEAPQTQAAAASR